MKRSTINIPSLLDKRSYCVYRLRNDEKKLFREIAAFLGLSPQRVRQIYWASIQRIELKKRGGDIWPEYSLSLRAVHSIGKRFGTSNVKKSTVIRALKSRKLCPGEVRGYGEKTHSEVCKWAGVKLTKPANQSSRPLKGTLVRGKSRQ